MFVFIYSLFSYLAGVASVAYLIGWMVGIAPGAFGGLLGEELLPGIAWDLVLLALFGLQHSVMARQSFKDSLTKMVPVAAERSTYILMTGVVIFVMVGFWSPYSALAWEFSGPLETLLWCLVALGWIFMLSASFGTNHFELFGLRQAWLHMRGVPYTELEFTRSGIYGYIRHPIQTGILVGIWCLPVMRVDNLLMNIGITIYIAIGLWFEERDLLANFGEDYRRYKAEVGGLLPKLGGRRRH